MRPFASVIVSLVAAMICAGCSAQEAKPTEDPFHALLRCIETNRYKRAKDVIKRSPSVVESRIQLRSPQELIDEGFHLYEPINLTLQPGDTALMAAIRAKRTRFIQLLVDKHSDLYAIDWQGWNMVDLARFNGFKESASLILNAARSQDTKVTGYVAFARTALAKIIRFHPNISPIQDRINQPNGDCSKDGEEALFEDAVKKVRYIPTLYYFSMQCLKHEKPSSMGEKSIRQYSQLLGQMTRLFVRQRDKTAYDQITYCIKQLDSLLDTPQIGGGTSKHKIHMENEKVLSQVNKLWELFGRRYRNTEQAKQAEPPAPPDPQPMNHPNAQIRQNDPVPSQRKCTAQNDTIAEGNDDRER